MKSSSQSSSMILAVAKAYRATILRAPKGNVGLAVRKTVVALINQNLGQSLALCFVGGDRVAQRQWELHAHYGHGWVGAD
jgi:hypothetical protein